MAIFERRGRHAWLACPPIHVKSWCAENGIPEDEPIGSIAQRWCVVIRAYIDGRVNKDQLYQAISSKACLNMPYQIPKSEYTLAWPEPEPEYTPEPEPEDEYVPEPEPEDA